MEATEDIPASEAPSFLAFFMIFLAIYCFLFEDITVTLNIPPQ
jgi:hypothetical protein